MRGASLNFENLVNFNEYYFMRLGASPDSQISFSIQLKLSCYFNWLMKTVVT